MAEFPQYDHLQIAQLLKDTGWSGWPVCTFGAIVRAESNMNAYAINVVKKEFRDDGVTPNPAFRSLDVGLGQVNTYWFPSHKIADLLDPEYNLALCHRIYIEAGQWSSGYSRWTVYKTGAHIKYLPEALAAARAVGEPI